MTKIQDVIDQAVVTITAEDDAVDSAIALINTLVGLVQANINNPAALQDVLNTAKAKTQALADAVAANTPAAPAPTP